VGEVFSQSASVVLVSNKLKRIAEEQFGGGPNYRVIPNGIDPDYIKQFSHRQKTPLRPQKTILSVANLYPAKGIDLNLKAVQKLAKQHPDLKYQIIGAGPEQGNLLDLAQKLGIINQVEFLGQLPHPQVMKKMAECDIFSLPSWQEGFGIVYLEAMAHGKPVIGCRGEGIEDFVVPEETGYLVKPGDVDDLVRVLDDLLAHPHRGTQTGKAAQKHVLENYTWEKNAQRTVQLYQEISHGR
jgi:glycosyltransferase involved in cell wall biosynthesis